LLPALAWLLRRRSDAWRPWRGFVVLGGLALVMRLWVGHLSDRNSENLFFMLNHHLPGLLLEFLLGVLTWRVCRMPWAWAWRWLLMGVGLVGWLALAVLFGQLGDAGVDAGWLRGQLSWMAALCFALMVTGSLAQRPVSEATPRHDDVHRPSVWQRGLHGAALWAGKLSYGVYLFHLAALQLVSPWREPLQAWPLAHQGVALWLTLAMAWLSLRFCEDPLRRWGRRLAQHLDRS
jgi:peptidoglycan/LPS O-acetylase OafA/YrhL